MRAAKFKKGDRVRVLNDPTWADGYTGSGLRAGQVGVVTADMDNEGDYEVKADSSDHSCFIGESSIEHEQRVAKIGTATFDVEVRFFIDGNDVTDRIKAVFA